MKNENKRSKAVIIKDRVILGLACVGMAGVLTAGGYVFKGLSIKFDKEADVAFYESIDLEQQRATTDNDLREEVYSREISIEEYNAESERIKDDKYYFENYGSAEDKAAYEEMKAAQKAEWEEYKRIGANHNILGMALICPYYVNNLVEGIKERNAYRKRIKESLNEEIAK